MSGRIRSLKPEWIEDELLVACSSDARVLSAGLILLADDYGNGRAGELYLTSRVFPGKSPETLRDALKELLKIRYVLLYEVDGQRYFAVRNWKKHQKVSHPGKPLVPGYSKEFEVSQETLRNLSGDPPETLTPDRDRDRDRDRDQRPTMATSGESPASSSSVVAEPRPIRKPDPRPETQRFRMHLGWQPSETSKATVLSALVEPWAVPVFVAQFVGHFAESEDECTNPDWNRRWQKWAYRGWNDAEKRPRRPTDEAAAERAKAEQIAAQERAQASWERHREAEREARSKVRGIAPDPLLPTAIARLTDGIGAAGEETGT